MNLRHTIAIGTIGAALCGAGAAFAAAGTDTGQVQMRPMSEWADDYSSKHNGRVSRDAYMTEVGRRWDEQDKTREGLTLPEVEKVYAGSGQVPVQGPAPGYQPTP